MSYISNQSEYYGITKLILIHSFIFPAILTTNSPIPFIQTSIIVFSKKLLINPLQCPSTFKSSYCSSTQPINVNLKAVMMFKVFIILIQLHSFNYSIASLHNFLSSNHTLI